MTDTATTELVTRDFEGLTIPKPATFKFDATHSEVGFLVKHMMVSKVRGRFGSYEGSVAFAENPTESTVEITIDMTSIDTRDEGRDAHLRSADFFDVDKYPSATFKSKSVTYKGGSDFAVTGDLTLRDVTRPITLDVSFEGVVADPWGGQRVGFTASGELDRFDYGLSFGAALETGGLVVGKKVSLQFEVEAVRAA